MDNNRNTESVEHKEQTKHIKRHRANVSMSLAFP
jgi:hypothetical protein